VTPRKSLFVYVLTGPHIGVHLPNVRPEQLRAGRRAAVEMAGFQMAVNEGRWSLLAEPYPTREFPAATIYAAISHPVDGANPPYRLVS
jgi:hypothetical protein